ncbi:MAG TPA: UvrD-helicase domain-containing protein [Nitrolancea sp.]|nr:UvrD-helicase domain-containing protein [Nitrolancea sp.]
MFEGFGARADLLEGLNEAQVRAVTAGDGPVLIVAGPGSGKTRVLTHRIAYLIDERGVSPWNILAVTFTNKAAREMRERLERLIGPEQARKLTVGTFHATCARILRQHGQHAGIDPRFTIYDDADQIETVKQALKALNLDPKEFSPRGILSRISSAKSRFVRPEQFAEVTESYFDEIVARVYPRYQETLRQNRALDFDDLLAETLRLFDEQPEIKQRYQEWYRYVLVDEYQDTNHVQYLLVRALAERHRNLCVVGDPDQSIYGWRQADIRNILDFKRDYPEAQEIHLELNYRSTGVIVAAADRVIRENTQRIQRQLRTENAEGEPIVLRECFDDTQEAQFVAGEIRRLSYTGRFHERQVAVMYRTNAQSRALEEAFIRGEIPYQLIGGTRFYERREVKDTMALLRLIANPRDAVSLQRLLQNTPLGKGIGAKTLTDLERWARLEGRSVFDGLAALAGELPLAPPQISGRAARLLGEVYATLSELVEASRRLVVTELFDLAVAETGIAAQLQQGGDPEMLERWENVLQLRAVLSGYDELPTESALETFLEESALVADADTMEESGNQVTLITLHAAKGLEFPVVFLVGVEEGILPHARSLDTEDELEEERRLFYVGLTRAQERLYITHAFRRSTYGRSDLAIRSRFVDAIPDELIESTEGRSAPPASRSGATIASPRARAQAQLGLAPTPMPASAAPAALPSYSVGDRVFHQHFGDGQVVAVTAASGDLEVTVNFVRHGTKRLMASLANLLTE